jgi:Outer membrane receptor for ferrienterochelin and colicins
LYVSYNYDNYGKYEKYLKLGEKEENYRDIIHNPKIIFSTEAVGNNTILVGAELLGETLDTYQFKDGNKNANQVAAFVQDDYMLNNRFSVQAGVRMDYHSSYEKVNVIPKISFMYKMGENREWNLRAGYSGGYRTPTLKELYTTWEHQGMFVLVGNDKLKAEKSHNVQGGVEFTKGKINVSANAFYNHIYDKISTIWNVGQDTSYYANIDKSTILGADANIRVQLFKQFAVRVGYAYIDDNQKVAGLNMSSTRPHSATIRLEYNFNAFKIPFTLGLNGRWLSKVDLWSEATNNEYEMTHYPGYQMWKVNLVGRTDFGLRFNVGVNNIFNYKPKVVTYNAGITRGTTIFAGISIAFEEMFKK